MVIIPAARLRRTRKISRARSGPRRRLCLSAAGVLGMGAFRVRRIGRGQRRSSRPVILSASRRTPLIPSGPPPLIPSVVEGRARGIGHRIGRLGNAARRFSTRCFSAREK